MSGLMDVNIWMIVGFLFSRGRGDDRLIAEVRHEAEDAIALQPLERVGRPHKHGARKRDPIALHTIHAVL